MIKITPVIRGAENLVKQLKAENTRQKKALNTAIKVTAFGLRKRLVKQVRAGRPGGRKYIARRSKIAQRTKVGKLRKNQAPLNSTANLIRYKADNKNGDLQISFGFVEGPIGKNKLTASWKKLLKRNQEGTDVLYGGSRTLLGRRFAKIGGRLKKEGDPDAKFFFLKRRRPLKLNIPERPIMDPFWKQNEVVAKKEISINFRRKLKGERI